ncbi:MAG: outer membrane beta-barrel protein [Alphaproteobacteria bacterium]|nr:outer membrane beta-barrel protein [Alphaproteobacteria bacterium]
MAAASLAAVPAHAQSGLPLKPSLDTTEEAAPPPIFASPAPVFEDPVPVKRRARQAADPYAPTGVAMGGLRLYPSITIGSIATTNLPRSASDPKKDAGLNLRPSLRIESDWVRHAWNLDASGDLAFYARNNDLNSRDLDVSQRLRLDVRRGTTADLESSYSLSQSGLEDSDVPATAVGYQTEHALAGSTTLTQDFGPIEGRIRGGATWRRYDDVKLSGGGTQSNADREYVEPSLSLRATLTDGAVFRPFVEVGYAPRLHRLTYDRNGLKRDSQGYSATAGLGIDSGPVWSGDLGLTYLRRTYEDPALKSNSAVGLTGNVTWNPSELTRIVLGLGTTLSETTSATSSGSRNWSATLDFTHALRENIDVAAGAGVEISKADGGSDVTYDASLDLSWKINPTLAWTAGYDFTWLDAATSARDYKEHRVTAGITLRR